MACHNSFATVQNISDKDRTTRESDLVLAKENRFKMIQNQNNIVKCNVKAKK